MRILIVSATEKEIALTRASHTAGYIPANLEFLITGPGLIATAAKLSSRLLVNPPDIVINAGICGSFRKEYPIGFTGMVIKEIIADFGVEDNGTFLPAWKIGLIDPNEPPFTDGILINPHSPFSNYPSLTGISNNRTHGEAGSIQEAIHLYNPDIESMEGASVFYCCLLHNIKFAELRTVSNFVEPRNTSNWNIPMALCNLHTELVRAINICTL